MATVSLLTVMSETGFQSFLQGIRHWEMNPDQDTNHALIGGMQFTQKYS